MAVIQCVVGSQCVSVGEGVDQGKRFGYQENPERQRKPQFRQESCQQVHPKAVSGQDERREAAPARFPAVEALPRSRLC